ncbi:F0F1 ATP synthase subunit A [Beijerinckia indica]|uniref:ATP synthase subunit a n=1 Tax=Beijerinckia indica subsp. indica (strain ATCC 9039 / DSM 1715 / NCIMB 8712) TaxID=395963 RepID=ATP6_BEII9|nr:F0F1 ATP synthase subunit A [Beijerinckia indica]B2IGL1.1 RecName: Full=ATP synthase subunit a; AltName: Full=ATP synthase F0 sector subunit a; AltName: Full=F-ATPase subunit 6 [Beijerinckia indica subsp. indica ATCC 9039]ACB94393.1 ATP synthase F0, A subunit [Beijerinckia indica subsp. indica ATCC 9039]
MAEPHEIDPIHQFHIDRIIPLHFLGTDVSFTNAAFFMLVIVALASLVLLAGTRNHSLVPGRLQSIAEVSYEFIASTLQLSSGRDGMRFFPFVFSIFMFVFLANLIGLVPYTFTVTSQIAVTFGLAMIVIGTVVIYGLIKHGTHFLGIFAPSGVSPLLLPFMIMIEVISFISRPISLSIRLFANMLAGHITLKVMGGFVAGLLGAGSVYALVAPLPLAMVVIFTAFELLVAFLQAYVFTILTCVYLNDAVHPGH